MTIYPAIDLRGGKCVRLLQGRADQETVYGDDPVAVARGFAAAGARWTHMVDLDGAFSGEPKNAAAAQAVARESGLRVELGGGLRSLDRVEAALGMGVARVVIGTKALEDEAFLRAAVARHGDRVAVGIDARDGYVTVRGWVETTPTDALALARRVEELGVRTIIYTDISTDGMLTGPNLPALERLLGAVRCGVIASGGVGSLDDIRALSALGRNHAHLDGVIVGKAIYERKFTVAEAIAAAQ